MRRILVICISFCTFWSSILSIGHAKYVNIDEAITVGEAFLESQNQISTFKINKSVAEQSQDIPSEYSVLDVEELGLDHKMGHLCGD